jgi:hypothetical protein
LPVLAASSYVPLWLTSSYSSQIARYLLSYQWPMEAHSPDYPSSACYTIGVCPRANQTRQRGRFGVQAHHTGEAQEDDDDDIN